MPAFPASKQGRPPSKIGGIFKIDFYVTLHFFTTLCFVQYGSTPASLWKEVEADAIRTFERKLHDMKKAELQQIYKEKNSFCAYGTKAQILASLVKQKGQERGQEEQLQRKEKLRCNPGMQVMVQPSRQTTPVLP